MIFPRHPQHAIHSVHAEDEPMEAMEQQFARPPARLAKQRRLAAMALLGAGVGIVAVLVAHGLHAPGVGGGVGLGPHSPGGAAPVMAAPLPHGAPVELAEGGSRGAHGRHARPRSSAPVRRGKARLRGEEARLRALTQARVVSEARGVVSPPAAGAVVAVAGRAAGSEFDFER